MKMNINQPTTQTQSNTFSNPQWYIIQTFSNYESMAKLGLERMIENYGLSDQIFEVKIPTEKTVKEYANGKKKIVERKLMPNYIFVKLIYSGQLAYLIRNIRGILGFVEPVPMKNSEVQKLHLEEKSDVDFSAGEEVTVLNGPLNGLSGIIRSCDPCKQIAKVSVMLFQKEQEVNLQYVQLQKVCA